MLLSWLDLVLGLLLSFRPSLRTEACSSFPLRALLDLHSPCQQHNSFNFDWKVLIDLHSQQHQSFHTHTAHLSNTLFSLNLQQHSQAILKDPSWFANDTFANKQLSKVKERALPAHFAEQKVFTSQAGRPITGQQIVSNRQMDNTLHASKSIF